MKATIILSTVILFAVFMGCSDSGNILQPQDSHNIAAGQQKVHDKHSPEVIWKKKDLTVQAAGRFIAENKVLFTNIPFTQNSSYKIEFDVITNANVNTNGYLPEVQIINDNAVVYYSTVFADRPEGRPNHIEFGLNNTRLSELEFYAALTPGENSRNNQRKNHKVTLVICNMAVYRMN